MECCCHSVYGSSFGVQRHGDELCFVSGWCFNVTHCVKVYCTDPVHHRRKCADEL
jgi:hypothetical protein